MESSIVGLKEEEGLNIDQQELKVAVKRKRKRLRSVLNKSKIIKNSEENGNKKWRIDKKSAVSKTTAKQPEGPKKKDKLGKNQELPIVKGINKNRIKRTEIFPDSLDIFRPLKMNNFYSRHFYTFKYILKPALYSASVTIFYDLPWITLSLLFLGFSIDFYLGWKKVIFKEVVNNRSIVVENLLFLIISVLYMRVLISTDDIEKKLMKEVGWSVAIIIFLAFICLVYFKCKGQKAL